MSAPPSVTVVIPARNESADIRRCIEAVLAQDYPHGRMEIVVVDGGSSDSTVDIVTRVLESGDIDWTILDNPKGSTPSNLNAGLSVAKGEILCRIDARSLVPSHYVATCVSLLRERPDVAVAGGRQVAIATPQEPQRSIARALNNRYGMGLARYRSGAPSGPGDTVYLGAFRVRDLRAHGGWNEWFETNQDFDLNRRMAQSGLVWVDGRLEVRYVPRRSFRELARQYHRFGRWKVRYWRRTGDRPRPRQWALLIALPVTTLAGAAAVVGASRPLPRLGAIAAFAGAGILFIDHVGSEGPASAPRRMRSSAALATVGGAWLSGVFREFIVGD